MGGSCPGGPPTDEEEEEEQEEEEEEEEEEEPFWLWARAVWNMSTLCHVWSDTTGMRGMLPMPASYFTSWGPKIA